MSILAVMSFGSDLRKVRLVEEDGCMLRNKLTRNDHRDLSSESVSMSKLVKFQVFLNRNIS